jgi:cell division septation protein DedD
VAKNEDGEFELILGNRQLLSVFFIWVVLMGVFFTIGYIVGRNSAPVAAEIASAPKGEEKPLVVNPPTPAPERPAEAPAQPRAAASTPPAAESAPKSQVEKPRKTERPAAAIETGQPAAGRTYLQLAATVKDQADALVDVLRKNGFHAVAAQVPEKPALYRVLVGPLGEGEVNKTRAELQGKGFQGNAAIKKTF